MIHKLAGALLVTGLAAGLMPAQASTTFRAVMTHDQEVATPGIPDEGSSGIATFVLNDAMTRLTYDVTLTGLDLGRVDPLTGNPSIPAPGSTSSPNDDVLRMHIHRALVGNNGGIVYGMIDAGSGLRNDNNPNDLVIDVTGLRVTGAWDLPEGNAAAPATLATELTNLFAGGLYINVHTSDHAGGEIRGQILAVPEPETYAMMLAGLVLVGWAARGRKAA